MREEEEVVEEDIESAELMDADRFFSFCDTHVRRKRGAMEA